MHTSEEESPNPTTNEKAVEKRYQLALRHHFQRRTTAEPVVFCSGVQL
jgi:hypothetical protein